MSNENKQSFYPSPEANPDFVKLEKDILRYWQDNKTFENSVSTRDNKDYFVFYDGPPFANGLPHYGHLLTGYVKDMVARYQTMRGKKTPRRFGWDCHGLPAEMAAEKELEISGRQQITEYGIGKFNEHCRTSVMKYAHEWERYVNAQARWVDFENDYKTMDKDFMESVIWAFKELYKKDLVYESYRVMPYSWAAETPLSNFETKLDNSYREREDKAITVAFELEQAPKSAPKADAHHIMAWTTTPWTLPSNLALAASDNVPYVNIIKDDECYILAMSSCKKYQKELIEEDRFETERCILRPFRQEDAEILVAMHTNEEVMATTNDGVQTKEEALADLELYIKHHKKHGYSQWAVFNKETGEFMGRVGLQRIQQDENSKEDPKPVLRCALLPDYWSSGYGTELCRFVTMLGFVIFDEEEILGGARGEYKRSHKMMENIGYQFVKTVQYKHVEGPLYRINREQFIEHNSIKVSELVGLKYKPLFPYFEAHENSFRILDGSSFIEDGEGTGIVHMAPGFGEDDMRVCAENGIEVVVPVDDEGRFTDEIYDLESSFAPTLTLPRKRGRFGGGQHSSRKAEALKKAKELRKNSTNAEKIIWEILRNKQIQGNKFRRQHSIGNYIVDFVCIDKKLVIEIDGDTHSKQQKYDKKRTEFLEQAGFSVIRFWNNEVINNLEGVYDQISRAISPDSKEIHKFNLNLKGLNVIADTRLEESDPFNEKQVHKYGLANLRIIHWLKQTGQLIKQEDYLHNYPHCWRTDQPIIYRAMSSWYVAVSKFKDRAVEINQQINWIPSHVKDGAMGHMLATAPDWSISRNRFWGCPIPIWRSDNPDNDELYVFGSIAELEEFFDVKIDDLHRPFIDELTKPDPENPKYTLKRVTDVFDCWFESGSMPFAQLHYPFENKDLFEQNFPADFITEYVGQTRGWFNTLIMLSTALFDKPPFKNCICHGVVLDEETGLKYSKRLKNYKDPMEVFDKFGSDALRWMMLSSPVMRGADIGVDPEGRFIRDVVRLHIKPLWNTYNFFCMYANADFIKADFSIDSKNIMDKYILAKTEITAHKIKQSLDAYDAPGACQAITTFLETLNNWYIRRSRLRFWQEEKTEDKYNAYNTLYVVLHVITRSAAPLLPLTTEQIYKGITGADISIHLADYPDELEGFAKQNNLGPLIEEMDKIQEICNAAHSIRNNENIRIRQPLAKLEVYGAEISEDNEQYFANIIADETNVKNVEFSDDLESVAKMGLKINFKIAGKRLGKQMKSVAAAANKGEWEVEDGLIHLAGEILQEDEFDMSLEPLDKNKGGQASVSSNDALVVLDISITPELASEGLARDVVRIVQQARKDAGLHVSDRIELIISSSGEIVGNAVSQHKSYISEQVLASELKLGEPKGEALYKAEQSLEGETIIVKINKAA